MPMARAPWPEAGHPPSRRIGVRSAGKQRMSATPVTPYIAARTHGHPGGTSSECDLPKIGAHQQAWHHMGGVTGVKHPGAPLEQHTDGVLRDPVGQVLAAPPRRVIVQQEVLGRSRLDTIPLDSTTPTADFRKEGGVRSHCMGAARCHIVTTVSYGYSRPAALRVNSGQRDNGIDVTACTAVVGAGTRVPDLAGATSGRVTTGSETRGPLRTGALSG